MGSFYLLRAGRFTNKMRFECCVRVNCGVVEMIRFNVPAAIEPKATKRLAAETAAGTTVACQDYERNRRIWRYLDD
jgi:hypothetical protein